MSYEAVLTVQRSAAAARGTGELEDDLLLLVEHAPVVTMGRGAKGEHLVVSREFLAERGAELFEVERGGDVTFHGPGQLVGYPIIDLQGHTPDLHWYLRQLEQALILSLRPFGIEGRRNPGFTGVWVEDRKLASIGIRARNWVTWHGFALNVSTDLSWFDLIVPCGIRDVEMTSVARERERANSLSCTVAEVQASVVGSLGEMFARETVPISVDTLYHRLGLDGVAV